MYHGIIIDQSLKDHSFVDTFQVFNKKQDGDWGIYGIEIEDNLLDESIKLIQENLKSDQPWYAHLYNDQELIVIFKERFFKIISDKVSWQDMLDYGQELNIPEDQLQISPVRFQDEIDYFK